MTVPVLRRRPALAAGPSLALACAALVLHGACVAPTFDFSERWATPAYGMVVSEHELATAAGVEVLERGGNAADAAVATALALAVVYPQAGNLGGGGFALWVAHDADEEPLVVDFRETAPAGLTGDLFVDASGRFVPSRSVEGPLAVAVPGSPAGLWTLQREKGRLAFRDVVAPALRLAREGFEVDESLAEELARPDRMVRLTRRGMAKQVFYPRGEPLRAGQLLRQPELARTLELLANGGPDAFYRGAIARVLADTVQAEGGVLTVQDLEAYQVRLDAPLRGWFRGYELLTVGPPSSGGIVLLQVLSMLDGFPLDEEREAVRQRRAAEGRPLAPGEAALSGRALHWWVEAMRLAFADRSRHLGDPSFVAVPVSELLSPERISARRVSIGELANPGVQPLALAAESEDTTHVSVLDGDGNACSLTTTLNTSFGCGWMVPGHGFLLNNEIDDFAVRPDTPNVYGLLGGTANAIEPGKRPLSSMTPTVVRDGGKVVRMVLGSPGGPRIITAVIQVLLRKEVYGQSLEDAVAAPRLHQQWAPSATRFEEGWDPVLLQRLRDRLHEVDVVDTTFGSVQAIFCEVGGEPVGVSDPRRGGAARAER